MTMTKREVFETVKAHLLTQGCKALGDRGCMYRGENGTKCAAGCLIADEHYQPSFEGGRVARCDVENALLASGVPVDALTLVECLQSVHDSYHPVNWPDELSIVESNFFGAARFHDAMFGWIEGTVVERSCERAVLLDARGTRWAWLAALDGTLEVVS